VKIFQGDDVDAGHHQANPQHPSRREDLSDKEDGPDLGEERGGAGDGIDQGEIPNPISLNQADEIDRFEKA